MKDLMFTFYIKEDNKLRNFYWKLQNKYEKVPFKMFIKSLDKYLYFTYL